MFVQKSFFSLSAFNPNHAGMLLIFRLFDFSSDLFDFRLQKRDKEVLLSLH